MKLFGEKLELWIAIGFALLVKMLLTSQDDTEERTRKFKITRALVAVLSSGVVAFYGHDYVIRHFSIFTQEDEIIVVIMLTLTGEHIMRTLQTLTPEKLAKVVKWRQ